MGRLTETDDYPVAVGTASTQCSQADVIIRKVCVHLLPKFFLLTVTSYVDRWAAALRPPITSRCSYIGMWASFSRATEHDRTRLTVQGCRTNLAFAALTMNDDIHLSSFEYGLGSGLFFFLGYIIFQVDLNSAAHA